MFIIVYIYTYIFIYILYSDNLLMIASNKSIIKHRSPIEVGGDRVWFVLMCYLKHRSPRNHHRFIIAFFL